MKNKTEKSNIVEFFVLCFLFAPAIILPIGLTFKIEQYEQLKEINDRHPTVVVKHIFVDIHKVKQHVSTYNRAIVEDSAGVRYIIQIDDQIPLIGETWEVLFLRYDHEGNVVGKFLKKVKKV